GYLAHVLIARGEELVEIPALARKLGLHYRMSQHVRLAARLVRADVLVTDYILIEGLIGVLCSPNRCLGISVLSAFQSADQCDSCILSGFLMRDPRAVLRMWNERHASVDLRLYLDVPHRASSQVLPQASEGALQHYRVPSP